MRLSQCAPGLHGFLGKAQIGRVTLKQSESYLHISVEACIVYILLSMLVYILLHLVR